MITAADYWRPETACGDLAALRGATLADWFDHQVTRRPDAPAVIDGDHSRTWRQWDRLARDLMAHWQAAGIHPGDVVGLHLPSSWHLAAAHVALARLGAVTAMLHRPYTPTEVSRLLTQVGASMVVSGDGDAPPRIHRWDPPGEMAWPEEQNAATPDIPGPSLPASHPLALFFTSGTEGPSPKACLHTHDGLLSNACWVAEDTDLRADDCVMAASAFTHLFGCLALHLTVVSGARQVVLRRFSAARFWELATRHAVSIAFAVPAQLYDLIAWRHQHPEAPALPLRELRVAGAYLPAALAERAAAVLDVPLVSHWGMSELGAGSYTRATDPPAAAYTTIGRVTRGSEALIRDDAGRTVTMPGVTGSLLFRGPSLFMGYYRNPEATRAAYVGHDGRMWFQTGDLAHWTTTGQLAYGGRSKDLINRGGMKVSPQEVETALQTLPAIRQAALLAESDERLGERGLLVASVAPGAHLDLNLVRAHLEAAGLARFKWPERLVVWPELPLTPTGKVAKGRLRTLLALDPPAS